MSKNKFINFNIEKLKNNITILINDEYKMFNSGKIVFIISKLSNDLNNSLYNDFNVLSEKFIKHDYKIIMINENKLENIKTYIKYFIKNKFDDLIIIYNCELIDLNKFIKLFSNNNCNNILIINNYCKNDKFENEIPKNCCLINTYQNDGIISSDGIIIYYLYSYFDNELKNLLNDINLKLERFNQNIKICGSRKYLYI